jgi:cell division control protein 24
LARFTPASIGGGSVRLRYRDEDGDYIWIDSDEAVNDAFLDWRETHADKIATGSVGEILLFCSSLNGEPLTASG